MDTIVIPKDRPTDDNQGDIRRLRTGIMIHDPARTGGIYLVEVLREPTFQVTLDAIALTPCYPAFLITADVPEVYMHQFWNLICPRVQDQDFDALPTEEDTVSLLRDLGHIGDITSVNDVIVNQMHQPWRTFAALINRSLSGKTSSLDKLRLSRAQII
ncbi:hypothetical protein Tco_1400870 [Tanacetum coccineum]